MKYYSILQVLLLQGLGAMSQFVHSDHPPVLLQNGTFIKGDGSPALEHYSLMIQGDRIIEIGKDLIPPVGTRIIDCTGQSILPGLIDMHGHLWGVTGIGRESHFATFPSLYLAGGVTTSCL